jgi:hypothetical protein
MLVAIKMFATIYKSPIENESSKDLVSHMLHKMDIEKYRRFVSRANKYPNRDHKFVVFEYVESPTDSLIARSERIYRGKMSIHSMITHPDFEQNMTRLFVDSDRVSWYTRRKLDYTKPFGVEQLSDTRQLVLIIKADEYSDMPPLISTSNVSHPVVNPEEDLRFSSNIWNHNQAYSGYVS